MAELISRYMQKKEQQMDIKDTTKLGVLLKEKQVLYHMSYDDVFVIWFDYLESKGVVSAEEFVEFVEAKKLGMKMREK